MFSVCHANSLFFLQSWKVVVITPPRERSAVFSFKNWAETCSSVCFCLVYKLLIPTFGCWLPEFVCFSLFLFLSFSLTHPDFSKLPRSKFLHHLNGIFGNLPGVFVPRLLSFGFHTRAVQFSTQAICFVWEVVRKMLRTASSLPSCSRHTSFC